MFCLTPLAALTRHCQRHTGTRILLAACGVRFLTHQIGAGRTSICPAAPHVVSCRATWPICGVHAVENWIHAMPENSAHCRAKTRAAGLGGRTEVCLSGGQRLDVLTRGGRRTTEIERSGSMTGLHAAAQRLKKSGARQKVMQFPQSGIWVTPSKPCGRQGSAAQQRTWVARKVGMCVRQRSSSWQQIIVWTVFPHARKKFAVNREHCGGLGLKRQTAW